jgi:hypothetical protein
MALMSACEALGVFENVREIDLSAFEFAFAFVELFGFAIEVASKFELSDKY